MSKWSPLKEELREISEKQRKREKWWEGVNSGFMTDDQADEIL